MSKIDHLVPISVMTGAIGAFYFYESHYDPWGTSFIMSIAITLFLTNIFWRIAGFFNELIFGKGANDPVRGKRWTEDGKKE